MARIPQDLLDEFESLPAARRARFMMKLMDRAEEGLAELDKTKDLGLRKLEAVDKAAHAWNQIVDADKKQAEKRVLIQNIFASMTGDQERDGPAVVINVNNGEKKPDEAPPEDE